MSLYIDSRGKYIDTTTGLPIGGAFLAATAGKQSVLTVPSGSSLVGDYTGNGTADDVAIQAAIASTAEKVYLSAGTFNISTNLTATSGLTLEGEGYNTLLKLKASTTKNILNINNVDNVTIRNIRFDGNRANNTDNNPADSLQNCILISGSTNILIERCWLTSAIFHGLFVQNGANSSRVTIKDCAITDNGYRAIHAHGDGSISPAKILIENNHCYANGIHLSSFGYLLSGIFASFENTFDVAIIGNTVENEVGVGIDIAGSSTSNTAGRLVVKGNIVRSCQYGIQLTAGTGTIRNVDIEGNMVSNWREIGLNMIHGTNGIIRDVTVRGNQFLMTTQSPSLTGNITSGAAILSALASTTALAANTKIRIAGAGAASADLTARILSVDSSTQVTLDVNAGTTVTGAVVDWSNIQHGWSIGSSASGTVDNIKFTDNLVEGVGYDTSISGSLSNGVVLTRLTNFKIKGNTFQNNEWSAATGKNVYQMRCTSANVTLGTIIDNNFISSDQTAAIPVDMSAGADIEFAENYIKRGTSTGNGATWAVTRGLVRGNRGNKVNNTSTTSIMDCPNISIASAADQSITSSTTLADITSLSFPIAANEVWQAQFNLDVGAALSTTGIKLAINAPTGCVLNVAAGLDPDVFTALDSGFKRTTVIATAVDFTTTLSVGVGDAGIVVNVYATNGSTAGIIQLQGAQSTSSGTALTFRKGSACLASRITLP